MRNTIVAFTMLASLLATEVTEAQRAYPVDFQIMPIRQSVRRQASLAGGSPTTATGTVQGVEAFISGATSGVGLFGRMLSGDIVTPKRNLITEGGLLLGDRNFRIEIGYAERYNIPADSTLKFTRGGFNYTSYLGTSGVALKVRAGYYAELEKFKGSKNTYDGWQGETSISYTWDRFPIFAQVGYRMDRLRGSGTDEEISALTLGGGLWLWGK